MRAHRLYCPMPLIAGQRVSLDRSRSRHLQQVLRAKSGDRIELFDGLNQACIATVHAVSSGQVEAVIDELLPVQPPARVKLNIAQSVARSDRMDYAIQKSTELGVHLITPILSKRCVVRLDEKKTAKRMRHWQEIIIAACEQSGRDQLPILEPPVTFEQWMERGHTTPRYILSPTATLALDKVVSPADGMTFIIGPEGGFNDEEMALARKAGCAELYLGPRVLRTETAGVAVLAAAQIIWGDFVLS